MKPGPYKTPRSIATLLVFLCIASCSSNKDKVSGPGGTETTNGIQILASNGDYAANAILEIVYEDEWKSSINANTSPRIDTVYANANGIVILPESDIPRTIRVIYQGPEGKEVALLDNSYTDLKLSIPFTITGTAPPYDKIVIAGTTIESPIDGSGNFILRDVPLGYHDLILITDSTSEIAGSVSISSDTNIVIDLDSRTIRLAKFTNTGPQSIFNWLGASLNFTYFSSVESSITLDSNSKEGASHTIYLGDNDTLGANYAALGMVFRKPDNTNEIDFSGTAEIKIRGRGTGQYMLKIWSPVLDSLSHVVDNGTKLMYWTTFSFTDEWSDVTLSIDDFKITDESIPENLAIQEDFPLSKVLSRVRRVEFLTSLNNPLQSEYDLELQSISLVGVSQSFW